MSAATDTTSVCDAQIGAGSALIVAGVISLALAVALVYVGALGVQESSKVALYDTHRAAAPTLMRTSGVAAASPPLVWANGVAVLSIVVGAVSLVAYLVGGLMLRYVFFGVLLALALLVVGAVAVSKSQSRDASRSDWLQAASGLWIAFVLLQFGGVGLAMTVSGAQLVARCTAT